jgi:carbon monoxide dehydrogenase subunit G
MLLKNEFEVDARMDQAWEFFTDLARVMPCMPGAALDGVEGENYLGNVKVKVGPIGAHFRGTAHFAQKDDAAHSALIVAAGKDPKGQAAANARIHARLEPISETRTRVLIDTDLDISGRMAQFGRGAIADVSNRLLAQFVVNISQVIGGAAPTEPAPSPPAASSSPTGSSSMPSPGPAAPAATTAPAGGTFFGASSNDEPSMDVLALVGPMVKERFGQAIIGGLLGFALSWLVFGRRGPRDNVAQVPLAAPWNSPRLGPWDDNR